MPTPDIDNLPEQIDIPDPLTTADQVPATLTPEQTAEVIETGNENPQPQIEVKATTLIEVINRLQNLAIEEFFTPIEGEEETLAEQRAFFKESLTIDVEADNVLTGFCKLYCLDRFLGLNDDSLAKVYGVPIQDLAASIRHKPQVTLKFREIEINQEDTPVRDYKLVKEWSFRLIGDNIPQSADDLSNLREKILNEFSEYNYDVSPSETYTYRDIENGYRLAGDCARETFIEIATKCLNIQNVTYDDQFLGVGNVSRPATPPTGTVLGKQVDLPFRGRYGKVYFWKAEYKQSGIEDRILAANIPLIP